MLVIQRIHQHHHGNITALYLHIYKLPDKAVQLFRIGVGSKGVYHPHGIAAVSPHIVQPESRALSAI